MNRIKELRARTLEFEAQSERALAAKQDDPQLRRMIENSATGKEELASELRGRPVKESRYERGAIHSAHAASLTIKR